LVLLSPFVLALKRWHFVATGSVVGRGRALSGEPEPCFQSVFKPLAFMRGGSASNILIETGQRQTVTKQPAEIGSAGHITVAAIEFISIILAFQPDKR
jgi:hypothetical protein